MGDTIKTTTSLGMCDFQSGKTCECTKEMREILSVPMDQHHFPYMHTCEDIFSQWAEYDEVHPMDQSPHA
jgi:hypothetical protein